MIGKCLYSISSISYSNTGIIVMLYSLMDTGKMIIHILDASGLRNKKKKSYIKYTYEESIRESELTTVGEFELI